MANTIKVSVLGDVRDINRKMGTVTQQLGGFEKTSKKIGRMAKAMFAGVAVGAAVRGIKDVVGAASDAQQSLGATETVFGKYADSVIANSKRAATEIGLSANEYRELSNVTGALLSGAGVPMKRLGGLTDDLNKRAADMAATFGGTTKEAVEAISSLMKGEADPIEKYGVSIKQTDVNARLAAKGQDKLTGAAKKQAEMQARLDLLMQKTSKTSGAFAKESNTLAHQQQVLGAQWENLKATLGSALLPILTKTLTIVNTAFNPAIKAIGDFLKPVIASVKEFFNAGSGGAGAMQTLTDFFNTRLRPAIDGIKQAFMNLWTVIQPIVSQVAQTIIRTWGQIQPQVQSIWNSIKGIIEGVLLLIQAIVQRVTSIIKAIWKSFGANILGFISSTMKNIANVIAGVMKVIRGIIKVVTSVIKGDWKGAWSGIKMILSGAWQAIKAIVSQAMNTVKIIISAAWTALKALTKAAWNGIKSAAVAAINGLINAVRGIKGKVTGALSSIGSWLYSAGKDLILGMINGVKDFAGNLAGAVGDAVSGAINKGKSLLGIKSPSRVFMKIGRQTIQGFAKGITDTAKEAHKAIAKVVKQAVKVADAKYDGKRYINARKRITRVVHNERRALVRNARAHQRVNRQLANAKKRLDDLKKAKKDYASNVTNSILDFGSVTNLNAGFTADAMAQQMQARIDKIKQYRALLKSLKNMGLNKTMYDDLVQAGVEGGMATAQALVAGGKASVKEFNSLQNQLNAQAKGLGNETSANMYNAGIQAANGLIRALNRKEAQLKRASKRLANAMVRQIKRTLGIKSPSRVFRQLGEYSVQGMRIGLEDTAGIRRQMVTLSKVMTDSFDPRLTTAARAERAGSNGGNVSITVNVPPTADAAGAGREVARVLDAYYKQGGRRAAV